MTTGLKAAGVDLDSLFKARTSAKIADVNIKSNGGVDISNRFEARGATTAIANTGFKSGGVDLSQLFKDINAASGPLAMDAGPDVSKALSTSPITTQPTSGAGGSGGTGSYTYSWTRVSGSVNASSTGILCNSPSSLATTFTSSNLASGGEIRTAVWRCTVSDGSTTAFDDINVQIERSGL